MDNWAKYLWEDSGKTDSPQAPILRALAINHDFSGTDRVGATEPIRGARPRNYHAGEVRSAHLS